MSTHTGDTISIRGSAVAGQVKQAVTEAKQAGFLGISAQMNPDKAASEMSKVSSIKVGHMPKAASTNVSGSAIGDAVVKLVRSGDKTGLGVPKNQFQHSLGLNKSQFNDVVKRIDDKVSGTSGLTAKATDYHPTVKQHSASKQAPGTTTSKQQKQRKQRGSTSKPTPNSVALGGGPAASKRDYSATSTGSGVSGAYAPPPKQRYGVPGYAPTAGKLDGGKQQTSKQQAGKQQADPVYTAGHASKLADRPGSGSSDQVGVPMLIAVIALAGVAAGLVRTWALRRL